MNRTIKFTAIAEAELDEATNWYEGKHDNLGLEFLQEIDRCLAMVAKNSLQFPLLQNEIRYLNARRFPYRIYFRTEARRVVILAIFHHRQDPAILLKRFK